MKVFLRIAALVLTMIMLAGLCACNDESKETEQGENKTDGVSYHIVYNGTRVALGAKADGVIEKLGTPQDTREIGDCGGLGALVKYSYSSIEVYVLESKTDGNIIDQIVLRDDLAETAEGVCIGMSTEDAKQKLGEPSASSDMSLTYESDKYALKLTLDGGNVTGIDYLTK